MPHFTRYAHGPRRSALECPDDLDITTIIHDMQDMHIYPTSLPFAFHFSRLFVIGEVTISLRMGARRGPALAGGLHDGDVIN
ncbi:hypothetical protein CVT25_008859 [Psilocybe cyanescens]|uniref:Uncharacterized protein n=1 Tax=Psilocybe cyanescens TaxID=93625 RepID=A0A409XAM1_PSICY|nr:hypothetical protein CVT25_008859 [Psilocybe cyanescens]